MEQVLADAAERRLVESALRQPEAFRELYHHYFPRVFAYVASHTNRYPDAEDLVSVIFLRVIEGLSHFEYRGTGAFAAWLFRIARNTVIDFHRNRRKQGTTMSFEVISDYPTEENGLVDSMLRKEAAALLRATIAELSPRRREVIVLRFFGGLRNREIAAILELDERSVASHLSRGLDDVAWILRAEGMVPTSEHRVSARLARVDESRRSGATATRDNRSDASRCVPPPVGWTNDTTKADGIRNWIDPKSSDGDLTELQRDLAVALDPVSDEGDKGNGVLPRSAIAGRLAILAWPARRRFQRHLEDQLIERVRLAGRRGPA